MEEKIYHKLLVERYSGRTATDEELMVFFKLLNDGVLDEYLAASFGHDNVFDIEKKPVRVKVFSGMWKKVAIAAAVTGLLATAVFLFFFNDGLLKNRKDTVTVNNTEYKTEATVAGDQRDLILPDGTKVSLNAASSIKYPIAFADGERIVELQGECYFEVAHNAFIPFRVKINGGVEVQVTGTHFNVYAYNTEPIKVTLLEGAVDVQADKKRAALKPGQQAVIKNAADMQIGIADMDEAVAWKNGVLQFNRTDVYTVMRQIERWYDVEVVYEGAIPQKEFVGKILKNSSIHEVLQILALSNIHCLLAGRKVTVLR